MVSEIEEIQRELSKFIYEDIIKIATSYSKTSVLEFDLVKELLIHIRLLNEYKVEYIHNEELNEIFQILTNEFKSSFYPLHISLFTVLEFLLKKERAFEKYLFVQIALKTPEIFFKDAYEILTIFTDGVQDLYKKMLKYVFNLAFLNLEENVQIDCIYKVWYLSMMLFDNNKAAQYAYKGLLKLFHQALHYKKTEVAFWLYYTPLHYFKSGTTSNIAKANEEFKNEVEKPLEKYILEEITLKYSLKPNKKKINNNKKIKVAFVMQRIIRHSTVKVFYSLVKALMKKPNVNYEFILYDLCFFEAGGSEHNFVEEFKDLGIRYINLHKEIFHNTDSIYSLLEKCLKTRERLIKDDIDILIGLHTRVEYIFLYSTRTAPKQIYWYHHSNAQYDIKGIDFRIKHGDFNINKSFHGGNEFLQFDDILDKRYLNPSINKELILKEKEKFPKNCIILGTIGRLSKINCDDYIKIIDDVLLKYPKVIYIAAGTGDEKEINKKINKKNLDKWFFVGFVEPHLYGNIIDIWPNTFPIPQGMSSLEFMAKGKPILTMKNNFHDFELQNRANLKRTDKFKHFKMNTDNIEDYKKSLDLLINSEEARKITGDINLNYIKKYYYNNEFTIKSFYKLLEEINK